MTENALRFNFAEILCCLDAADRAPWVRALRPGWRVLLCGGVFRARMAPIEAVVQW